MIRKSPKVKSTMFYFKRPVELNKYSNIYASGFETRIGYANLKSIPGGVYFYVQRNKSFSEPNAIIPFNVERLNTGQSMNLAKGVFTVPRNGTYHFSFTGMKDYSGVDLIIQLRLNEKILVGTASGGDRNGYFTFALKSTLKLVVGDQISLKKVGHGVLRDDDNNYTHFTGRLIEEDLSLP